LHTENATLRETVSELSSKISDPPGSHERWQELRQSNASLAAQLDSLQTSLAQAEEQIRTQADTIEHQAGLLREAHKYAEPLGRLAASVPDLRRLVEERGRKIRELTAERDRERENATRLAKKLDAARPDILREPDLRKIAEDLLPQFLATFSESLRGQK
jgi:peptidoglycan hydrolase CwlO-like protein